MVHDLDPHHPAIAAGDAGAFAAWLAGAEPSIRASLRRFAHQVDAEAVLQETLLRVWQVAPRVELDGRPNALLRFGVRVAHNLAVSELRRARSVPADPEEIEAARDPEPTPPPDPLLRRAIEECKERLPPKPSLAFDARLTSEGGEADATIAARLGMRTNTFLQNFTRARKLLLACLEQRGVRIETELA